MTMTITINETVYNFSFRGFGPQYAYENIAGEPFTDGSTRNTHTLMYATLLACNAETFKMSLTGFFDWLYEHPAEEKTMMQEMIDESARRASLVIPKKKE